MSRSPRRHLDHHRNGPAQRAIGWSAGRPVWPLLAALTADLASAAAEPAGGDGGPDALSLWGLIVPLLIVVGTGVLAWWIVRRGGFRGTGRGGPIRVVQAIPVGTRERLVVVRIVEGERAGEQLLVGTTAHRVELIERLGPGSAQQEPLERHPG